MGADALTPANAPLKDWIDTTNAANDLLCATIGDVGGTGLFGDCKAGGTAALHQVLKTFNLAIFSVASLFVAWNLLSGVMSAANDGEFLGKKNHSTWGPIRMVMGGAMLVPAFGGFNLAQLIMVWATAVGVGIAGAGASTAISTMNAFSQINPTESPAVKGRTVANLINAKTVCVTEWTIHTDKLRREGSLDTDATAREWGFVAETVENLSGELVVRLKYGEVNSGGGYRNDICGVQDFPLPTPGVNDSDGVKSILGAIDNAMRSAIPELAGVIFDEYRKVATGAIKDEAGLRSSRIRTDAAISAFDNTLNSAAQSAGQIADSLTSKISIGKGNWVAIGFGDVKVAVSAVAVANGATKSAKSTAATQEAPLTLGSVVDTLVEYNPLVWLFKKNAETAASVASAGQTVYTAASSASSLSSFSDNLQIELNKQVGELGHKVASQLRNSAKDSGGNPLRALIQLGVDISGWMAALVMMFLTTATVVAIIPFPFAGVSGLITVIGFLVMSILIPLMFLGIKLAAYLPFLISIIWAGAILNWLVIVVESLFGAPLWAMVHLDMEGEGLNTQKTGHGYIFLLNLLFRPIMMVGSLVFAKLAMNAIFGLFLGSVTGVLDNLDTTGTNWWANAMMIIGAVWVVVVFAEQIVTQSMSLIFQIPDKVFAWVGGHFGSNVGADLESKVGQQAAHGFGAAGQAGGAAGSMVAKGAGEVAASNSPQAREKAKFDHDSMKQTRESWEKTKNEKSGNSVSGSGGRNPGRGKGRF